MRLIVSQLNNYYLSIPHLIRVMGDIGYIDRVWAIYPNIYDAYTERMISQCFYVAATERFIGLADR